jgi:hypothetical protein
MIKDLEEAIYYCTITKAMKENEEEEKHSSQYQSQDMGNGAHYYTPMYYPSMHAGTDSPQHNPHNMRDAREGNSPHYRKMYMEGKQQHKDTQAQMKELEDYMHELTNDIMEMIEDATPEEKQLLRQKITTLTTKIK